MCLLAADLLYSSLWDGTSYLRADHQRICRDTINAIRQLGGIGSIAIVIFLKREFSRDESRRNFIEQESVKAKRSQGDKIGVSLIDGFSIIRNPFALRQPNRA
jgi:hypothetical protein